MFVFPILWFGNVGKPLAKGATHSHHITSAQTYVREANDDKRIAKIFWFTWGSSGIFSSPPYVLGQLQSSCDERMPKMKNSQLENGNGCLRDKRITWRSSGIRMNVWQRLLLRRTSIQLNGFLCIHTFGHTAHDMSHEYIWYFTETLECISAVRGIRK